MLQKRVILFDFIILTLRCSVCRKLTILICSARSRWLLSEVTCLDSQKIGWRDRKHEGKTKKYNRESCNFSDRCNLRIMNKDRQQSPTWCEGGHGMTQMRVESRDSCTAVSTVQTAVNWVKSQTRNQLESVELESTQIILFIYVEVFTLKFIIYLFILR